MATITWGKSADKSLFQGIDQVAIFVKTPVSSGVYGYAWDGVTAVNESPSGAEPTKLYADNKVYNTLYSIEEFAATLEAYQTPKAFEQCDGISAVPSCPKLKLHHKDRSAFVLVYHENVYNENGEEKNDKGGIYHIVLNCKAAPSATDHATINDSPEAATLSYELSTSTVPVELNGKTYNSAHFVIDATEFTDTQISTLEAALYEASTNAVADMAGFVSDVYDACPSAT